MTYTDDGRWLVISHPRSVTVLDAQTLRVAVADLPLPTEAPTDAFAVTAGQDHQLIIGTRSVLTSIDMDPQRWKTDSLPTRRTQTQQGRMESLPSLDPLRPRLRMTDLRAGRSSPQGSHNE